MICKWCKKEFEPNPRQPTQRFCNYTCKVNYHGAVSKIKAKVKTLLLKHGDYHVEEEKLKKKGIIQDLIDEKKVVYIDIDSIIESFVKDEKLKAEKEFDFNKEQIDKKYITKEEILAPQIYNENELQIKNECLNEIKKLNAYSNKIPNFHNWINLYGLNNYIN